MPDLVTRPPAPERVHVDVSSLRPLFQEATPEMDLSLAVLPGHPDDPTRTIARMAAKIYLKRLLVQLRAHGDNSSPPEARRWAQGMVDGLLRLPHERLLRLVLRPDVTSWTKAAQRVRDGHLDLDPRVLLAHAGNFLLPGLLHPETLRDAEIPVFAQAGEVVLPAAHVALRIPDAAGILTVRGTERGLHVAAGERVYGIPWVCLSDGPEVEHPAVRRLSALPDGPLLSGPLPWHRIAYPGEAEAPLVLGPDALARFAEAIGSGWDTVRRHWPEAAAVVRDTTVHIMPVRSQGNWPFNFTLPGFRGLVLTSERHTYLAAQTLVHESGHNRFNSILDVYSVAENAAEEHYSPFVEASRPLVNIFHGVLSFLNDVHMAIRCVGAFSPADGPAIEPYIEDITVRLTAGLDTLERHARTTEQGAQLLAGFRAAMPG
ncbi:HEXXH motif-containing putative peptide modification protein [Streptomyces violascens]|uniref:aKG-HExxH-type peptide beta-hydroxylase n=1 Tax=Streptomyces violascens TaxID=67381 RepID=UPI0036471CF5